MKERHPHLCSHKPHCMCYVSLQQYTWVTGAYVMKPGRIIEEDNVHSQDTATSDYTLSLYMWSVHLYIA